ncbi:hypothetical protein GCM10027348_42710 [Hymenobacter tenuis]
MVSCSASKLPLRYSLDESDKIVDFNTNSRWKPAWSDTLVARLERGVIPAYDQRNHPLPADSLRKARRLRGLVFGADPTQPPVHAPRSLQGILPAESGPGSVDLHFYDRGVALYFFYARVRQADLEKLVKRPVEFVPVK